MLKGNILVTDFQSFDDDKPCLEAVCPTCGQRGDFAHAGVQKVPPKVAEKLGFDHFTLWHCPNCNTTVSERDLLNIAS